MAVWLATAPADAAELAGTSWQLLNITSMDDRVYAPEEPPKYTLSFDVDGTARIVADCNRGSSRWISEASGHLEFGPVASTKVLCPPDSLSERYLAQFEWVRSYVMKGSHLYLATMADGAIIAFEPLGGTPLAAIVLGEEMRQEMTPSMIRQWKSNRQLYREYGGRVIFQQFGPEPLDAYRRFLEEQQNAGAFEVPPWEGAPELH